MSGTESEDGAGMSKEDLLKILQGLLKTDVLPSRIA